MEMRSKGSAMDVLSTTDQPKAKAAGPILAEGGVRENTYQEAINGQGGASVNANGSDEQL